MVITAHSVDIARPLPEVFAFLNDINNFLLWQAGLVSIQATNGMQPGSRITFTSVGLGRQFNLEAEVTANNGRDNIEAVSTQGPLTFKTKYVLEPTKDGTRLHLANDIRTGGIFNLAAGVLQSIGETRHQANLEQLKLVLENDVRVPVKA